MPSALLLVVLAIVGVYLVAGIFRFLRQSLQDDGGAERDDRRRGPKP